LSAIRNNSGFHYPETADAEAAFLAAASLRQTSQMGRIRSFAATRANGEVAPIPDACLGLPLRSSPIADLRGGERIVEDVPIAEGANASS
jgi:hypothetical protein